MSHAAADRGAHPLAGAPAGAAAGEGAPDRRGSRTPERDLPLVSVVVPVRNEERTIHRVLQSLLRQTYPRERMEILVVDGRSEDATRERVAELARRDDRIRLLDNPGRIVPSALNIALWSARGTVLARADGHTRYAPDYLERAIDVLEETRADVCGGPMRPRSESRFGRAVAGALTSRFGVGGSSFHFTECRGEAESVYLGVFRRDVFGWVGFFDEFFTRNQDDEWFYRARAAGARIVLDPEIRSCYAPRETCRALSRQYFGYGLYKPAVLAKIPGALRVRHLAPACLVAALLGLAVAAPFHSIAAIAFAALFTSYAAGLHLAAIGIRRGTGGRRPTDGAPLLETMLALSAMHLSYGLGFLAGLARRSPGGGCEQMRATYRRYREGPKGARAWDAAQPGQGAIVNEREAALAGAIQGWLEGRREPLRILDLGSGRHDLAAALERRGVGNVWVASLDLLEERLAESTARARVVADGRFIPFAGGTFDVVVQSTVLTSIGAVATRRVVAAEMMRVARPDSLILSYDARWPNPFNRRVRRLGRREHRALFAPARVTFRPLTVVPWLVRRWATLARLKMLRAFDLARVVPVPPASKGGLR